MKLRNLELDRLRAFAVIMTVIIHFTRVFFPWDISPEYEHGTTILNIWRNSWTGVDLFFVISGYIICKNIIESIDKRKNSPYDLVQYIKTFYIKRIYRIYPLVWSVFIFVFVCSFLCNSSGSFGQPENIVEAGIAIFTYTFNYFFAFQAYHGFTLSPYWSLSLEEQFYLLLPLFLIFTRNNKQRVLILMGILTLITFYFRPFSPSKSLFLTQTRCDGLIYGCLVYFLTKQKWISSFITLNTLRKKSKIFLTMSLIIALSSITALGFSNNIVIPLGCIIASILVTIAALEKEVIISFSYIQYFLDYVGLRSFSLYIIHFPMFSMTQEIMYRLSQFYGFAINSHLTIEYVLIALILTGISTEIIYKTIELPFKYKAKKYYTPEKQHSGKYKSFLLDPQSNHF